MFFFYVLNKIDDFFNKIEKFILFFFCLLLTLIMISQVVFRYFLNSPIFWAEEIAVQFLIFITVFGVSCLAKDKSLIRIDFLFFVINKKYSFLLN